LFSPLIYRRLTLVLFIALGVFIALTFRQHGISNDEEVQHTYGRLLLDFYTSGFADQDAFKYRNLYLYGGFFDLIAAVLERSVPIWVWDMRHLLSALFGFAGIYASYKIARLLGGERAGFVVVALLALTGSWSGAMFTHTKDVPFATCMVWALYYTIRISQHLSQEGLRSAPLALSIKLGIAVGCALGMRIGGVFSVLYLLLMLAVAGWVKADGLRARLSFWLSCVKYLLPAALVAFVLMAIFWPWGVMSPDHPLEAAKAFSHFTFNMLTVMDGQVMQIGEVPRDYLPAYLLVRLPEVFLIGLISLVIIGLWHLRHFTTNHDKANEALLLGWFTLLLAALFPLMFIMLDRPALYNGVRHFTFLLPPLAILAALGLCAFWDAIRQQPKLRIGFVAVCILLTLNTVSTLIRLHPYEYVYYNQLAGNTAYAESHWEGDYWSSSLREAAEMLEAEVPMDKTKGDGLDHAPYRVAVCAESIQGQAYLDHRFQITSDWMSADFFISSTNMNCDKVLQGRIIGTVERMGATLAVIKDRRNLLPHMRKPSPAPLTRVDIKLK
jgi:4-amino-4-deoxy-L-arabinose transferase-like glycosyltransferase